MLKDNHKHTNPPSYDGPEGYFASYELEFLNFTLGLCKNVPMRTGISSTTKNKRAEFVNSRIFDKEFYFFCRFVRCVNGFFIQRHNDNDDNKNRNNEIQ